MVRAGAVLPPRCVKCNEPALQPMEPRKLSWHHPALFLLILVNILIYVIVALLARKSAEVTFGLCARHRLRRRVFLAIGWGGLALGVLLMFAGLQFAAIGILLVLASFLAGAIGARTAYAARISKTEVRLAGCGAPFVDSIEANAPLSRAKYVPAPGDEHKLGSCPNCEAVIPLDTKECPECNALFGTGSEWKVEPLRP